MDEFGINASSKNSFAYLQDTTGSASTNYENDAIDFELSETKAEEYSDGFSSDWEEVKPEVNNWGSYTFSLGMGASLTMDKIPDGIQVRINKETGDIIIIGAKNAKLSYQKPDNIKISVINSDMDEISIGSGADSLILSDSNADSISVSCKNTIINDSRVDKIYGGSNDEYIEINNSIVDAINSNQGHDEIHINNSEIKNIDGGNGNDEILIYDSKVTGAIKGSDGDDYIQATNSDINYIGGNKGEDIFNISTSKINTIEGGNDNDKFLLNTVRITNKVLGGKGNDTFDIRNTQIGYFDGETGSDNFFIRDSDVSIAKDSKDKTEKINTDDTTPYEVYDDAAIDASERITTQATSQYKDGEQLTPEEQMQAVTINFLTEQLENMKEQFKAQENEDGKIRDGYNFIKELINIGVSKEDIKNAISEQEKMINELTAAINGESEESFEDCFKRWTGQNFNSEAITEYSEYYQLYQYAMIGCSKIQDLKNKAVNCDNLNEVFDIYKTFYGSEEKARQELNKTFQNCKISGNIILQLDKNNNFYIANLDEMIDLYSSIVENEENAKQLMEDHINSSVFIGDYEIKLTDDYQLIYTKKTLDEEKYDYCGMEEYIYEDVPFSIEAAGNVFKKGNGSLNYEALEKNFLNNFESSIGIDINTLQEKYSNAQTLAFGRSSSFQNLINQYCEEQDGFADKVGSLVQITGLGMMVAGGVVSFVYPPVGYGLMKAGQFTAVGGFFTDNVLDIADDIMSENGLSKEEFDGFICETLQEILLITSGAAINGVANTVQRKVFNATQMKVLSYLSEIGTDATLSILADYAITGNLDFSGEALSQLMAIITGIAGAKIKQYTKDAVDGAAKLFNNGDYDGAYNYLKSKGIPNKEIYKEFGQYEIERIGEYFRKTGNYDEAVKMAKSSKFFSYDIEKGVSETKSYFEKVEYDKVTEMIYTNDDLDFEVVKKYVDNSKVLTDSDLDYFKDLYERIQFNKLIASEYEQYGKISNDTINRIGNEFSLCNVSQLDKYWDKINTYKHGTQPAGFTNEIILEIGNGQTVDLKFDNNLLVQSQVSEANYKLDIPRQKILYDSQIRAIQLAFQQMAATGQKLPKQIYVTDLFAYDNRINGQAAGYFSTANSGTIFINASNALSDLDYLKETIYHESAHMIDYEQGKTNFLSNKYGEIISPQKDNIILKGTTIESYYIYSLISDYALTNNAEFVAEITALITKGTIRTDAYGNYIMKTDANGYYINAKCVKTYWRPEFSQQLNKIMAIYNMLTDGKIAQARSIYDKI